MTRNVRVRVPPPPGVTLIPEFITEKEEEQIIAELDERAPWERLSKRRVAHFVSRFDYASRGADKGGAPAPALPPSARAAVDRVLEMATTMSTSGKVGMEGGGCGGEVNGGVGASTTTTINGGGGDEEIKNENLDDNSSTFGPASADQVTVNDYPPGSGIAPHVDTHSAFTSRFASLSLGAGVAFELRRGGESAELWLPRRSLLLLGGEARLGWAHYIAPRRGDSVDRGAAAAMMDAEVARAVALAEEREKEVGVEVEGGGKGRSGDSGDGSASKLSTTVVIPRRRRVSITIRQIRPPTHPCRCSFPSECDSQGGGAPPTRAALAAAAAAAAREAAAGEFAAAAASAVSSASAAFSAAAAAGAAGAAVLERSLVSDVYDRIAPHFDSTRFAVWPQVASFVKKCCGGEGGEGGDGGDDDVDEKKKSSNSSSNNNSSSTSSTSTKTNRPPRLLLDVGCGNGKYLHLAPPGTAVLACEPCEGLARAARDAARGEEGSGFGAGVASRARAQAVCVARADGIAMPYRKGVFDGVICIAVIHHFATAKRRRALLASIGMRLAPGGRALVTAWATPDSQPEGKEKKMAARWVALESPSSGSNSKRPSGDFLVPWHEPPGWLKEKARREREAEGGNGGGGGGEEEEVEEEEREEEERTTTELSSPPKKKNPQQKKKGAPRIIQQAPPVAWRFYHCYERDELASDAAAGAAAASAGLLSLLEEEEEGGGNGGSRGNGEEGEEREEKLRRRRPVVVARPPYLDRGNWCVELWRRE